MSYDLAELAGRVQPAIFALAKMDTFTTGE